MRVSGKFSSVVLLIVLICCQAGHRMCAAQPCTSTSANAYWRVLRNISSDYRYDMRSNGYDQPKVHEAVIATIAWHKASGTWTTFARWTQGYLFDQSHSRDGNQRVHHDWECWGKATGQATVSVDGKLAFRGMPVHLNDCKWRCVEENWGSGKVVTKVDCGLKHPTCTGTSAGADLFTMGAGCRAELSLDVLNVQLAKPPAFRTMVLPAPNIGGTYLGGCEGRGNAKQCELGTADVQASVVWNDWRGNPMTRVPMAPTGYIPHIVNLKDLTANPRNVKEVTKCGGGVIIWNCGGKCLIEPK